MNNESNKQVISIDNSVYIQVGSTLINAKSVNSTITSMLDSTTPSISEPIKTTTYVDPVTQLNEAYAQSQQSIPTNEPTLNNENYGYNSSQPSTETTPIFETPEANDSIDNFDIDGPIITSYNATNIINNYNHYGDSLVDDGYSNSVEEQLLNSKDISLYTQQPKANVGMNIASDNMTMVNSPSPVPVPDTTIGTMQPITYAQESAPAKPISSMQVPDYTHPNTTPRYDYANTVYSNTAYSNNPQPNGYIPKSEFASRPDETETVVDKKIKKATKKFNFVLLFLYAIIIGIVGFIGYSYYVKTNDFYLGKNELTIAIGSSYSENVYRKGLSEDMAKYEFSSSDASVAKVNEYGKITGVKEGTTTINVKSKKTKRNKLVTVKVIDLVISDFTTDTNERVIYLGNNFTITPIINNQSNIILDLVWTSSDESIAKVTENGVVQPIKPGTTTITVSVPNTEFSTTVTIVVAKN